jgi:hypothetical protein
VIKTDVISFLEKYTCPTHYNGYAELVELLLAASEYLEDTSKNLKIIYYDTAKKYDTTRLCLERNLCTLIVAWSKRSAFKKLFDKMPTNSALITCLVRIMCRTDKAAEEYTAYDLLLA